jgi:hypothetical protein
MCVNITFIGNCQTLSLCFFFQKLLENQNYTVHWISYDEEFNEHVQDWADKCDNKILFLDDALERIDESDIIIYQEIRLERSTFSNTKKLLEIKKDTCRLIKVPSIYFDYNNYEKSINKLIIRENTKNIDIKVSNIFNKFKKYKLMLSPRHPKTSLFLEMVKELCKLLDIPFFTKEKYKTFIENNNFMELPIEI